MKIFPKSISADTPVVNYNPGDLLFAPELAENKNETAATLLVTALLKTIVSSRSSATFPNLCSDPVRATIALAVYF